MSKLSQFISSANVQNAAKLLSANVVAQIVGLMVYPILTRIYAPEDFGLLNLFLSIGGILAILSTAEYYNAIVLPKEDAEAIKVVHICLFLLLAVAGIAGISAVFSKPIANIFKTPELARYYWMTPILVLVLGGWNIINYWYIRKSLYNRISGYQLSNTVLASGCKIGFGSLGLLQGGLIYSVILAPLISLIFNIILGWKQGVRDIFQQTNENWYNIAKKYRNFPLYSLPKTLINMLAGQLPVLLLTPIFGTESVGLWSMAILLSFTPISLISRSLYQVLYQETATRVNNHQTIGRYFRNFTIGTLSIGIPLSCLLFAFMLDLVPFLLGDEWLASGIYIRWMLPWLLCSLLTSSTGFLADIFFKQKIGFGFEVLTVVLRVIGVVVGIAMNDFYISIIGYAVGSAVAVLAQFIWLMHLANAYDKTAQ